MGHRGVSREREDGQPIVIDSRTKYEVAMAALEKEIGPEKFRIWTVKMNALKLVGRIGKNGGSGATLMKVRWRNTTVVFKYFDRNDGTDDSLLELCREISFLMTCRHPGILQIRGMVLDPPSHFGVLMNWCPNGNIMEYMTENPGTPKSQRLEWLQGIAATMMSLNEENVIHRDLKLENVLLDDNLVPKIMDFGLGRHFVTGHGLQDEAVLEGDTPTVANQDLTQRLGTAEYMAPEVTTGTTYDEKCDVFSFGIMMYLLLTGRKKPYDEGFANLEMRVAENPDFRPKITEVEIKEIGTDRVPVMQRCWAHEPTERPSFEWLAAHQTLWVWVEEEEESA